MPRRPSYGRKPICLHWFVPFGTPTTPRIAWRDFANLIPSLRPNQKRGFLVPPRPCSSRVNAIWKTESLISGWQLGSDPEIQVATNVTNHLTAAILKFFADSLRLERAANLFERMMIKEPEIAALLARSYIGMSGLPVGNANRRRGDQSGESHA